MMKKNSSTRNFLYSFLALIALLVLVACPTTDEPPTRFLDMQIDKDNDSLLTFDSLIIKVYSKDSSFSQEVFHGVLRDPKQVASMPLDSRIGKEYTISIVGYKGGKVGVTKQVTVVGPGNFQSKDIPPVKPPDTIVITPQIPEILAPADTFVSEGDSLRIRITVRNPWANPTTLTLKEAITGAALDTAGRDAGDGYFTWRPTFDQGRAETYAVTFAYASADKKVEKIMRVKVLNVNRPPKFSAIADQKAKENETLTFKVLASDPDHDSLTLTAVDLPTGATFTGNTFTWKPSEGQANNYSVKFKAFDGTDSDQVAALITVGNVDAPPPVTVLITSPANDTIVNFTPITILYTVNGALLQKKYGLINGKNRIRVDTTILGRTGFDTVLITLDTIPPGAPVVSASSPVRTRTPSWTWVSGGNGNSIYRYRLDNEEMTGSTIITETAYTASKDLDVGTHTLFVQERDAAGNWSPSGRRAIRIDTTRPSAPSVSVLPSSPTSNPLPTWSWSASGDDLSGLYRYKLDTNDFRAGAVETKGATYTPEKALKEGSHALYVQVQDSAGNWSNSGSAVLVLDLTPPVKPKVTASTSSPTNNARPIWNIATGDGTGFYRVKLDDTTLTLGAKSGTFSTFTPDADLKEGVHTLYAQERDSSGNWSQTGSASLRVDLTPPGMPIFDTLPKSPLNSVKPTWIWKSGGEGGSGNFRCKLGDSTMGNGATLIDAPRFTPPANLIEGSHVLYVQERDSAGNWSRINARALVLALRGPIGKAAIAFGFGCYYPSLVLTADDVPYVGFEETDAIDERTNASVMRWSGIAWSYVGSRRFSDGYYAENLSLALSNTGVPYVAFRDDGIAVMRWDGVSWGYIGGRKVSPDATLTPSMVVSNTGEPYLAFATSEGKASVMRWNTSMWVSVGEPVISTGAITPPSLAIDGNGTPILAFGDGSLANKASVVKLNGAAWGNVGKAGLSAGAVDFPSLALSDGGIPYLAFIDISNGRKASVMKWNGSAWESLGKPGFTIGEIGAPSLKVSHSGVPYLAFSDGANSGKLTVMRWTGAIWEIVGAAGMTDGIAEMPSLALSSIGVPYVAYRDVGRDGNITVIKASFDP